MIENFENLKIDSKFESWNNLPPEVKSEYIKAMESENQSESTVKLNIGGTVFQTSKSTLIRFDGFFRTIMETNVPVAKDSSGCIVIDRDPKHFRLILNYMRDGDVDLPETLKELKEVDKEVKYYLMDILMERCHVALRKFDAKWADLSDKMKLNLIEYLDLRTKCSLRATARAEKALIDSRKHQISGVAFDGYYNVTIYVSYEKIAKETLSLPFRTKLIPALTYIFMYSDVERICMERGSYMAIQDLSELEKMVPSQSIHFKRVSCRGIHNFRNIETLLRLSWNQVESIDFNCCDESASTDELFNIPAVQNVRKLTFLKASTDQLVAIFDNWVNSDPSLGNELTLQTASPESARIFYDAMTPRSYWQDYTMMTVRMVDTTKAVYARVVYWDYACPMIYCRVVGHST